LYERENEKIVKRVCKTFGGRNKFEDTVPEY
jgi:hypothetical protein